MVLERAIHDLLYAHDCVIVPGFGGFLTHYRSARLDRRQRMLHPPGKDLSFNRNLTRSDGLLADEVARLEGTGHDAAKQRISVIVEAWQRRLDHEGRLELAQLGTFFLDAERNLQFEPDRRVNHLKDAYGLRPVSAVPVVRLSAPAPTPAPAPAPVVRELVVEPAEPAGEARRSNVLWAAAAFTAVLFAAGTYVMMQKGSDGAQWGSIGLNGPRDEARYVPRTAPPAEAELPAEDAFELADTLHGVHQVPVLEMNGPSLVVDLGPTPVPVAVAVPESTAVAMRAEEFHYHVIGGCFSVKENADSYMTTLQARGFSPVLVDRKGGLYRVALGSYPEKAMALEALAAARGQEAPEAWLLVK